MRNNCISSKKKTRRWNGSELLLIAFDRSLPSRRITPSVVDCEHQPPHNRPRTPPFGYRSTLVRFLHESVCVYLQWEARLDSHHPDSALKSPQGLSRAPAFHQHFARVGTNHCFLDEIQNVLKATVSGSQSLNPKLDIHCFRKRVLLQPPHDFLFLDHNGSSRKGSRRAEDSFGRFSDCHLNAVSFCDDATRYRYHDDPPHGIRTFKRPLHQRGPFHVKSCIIS